VKEATRLRDHDADELSHYSNATTDIEYRFPFGWGELWGIASRTDYRFENNIVSILVKTSTYHDQETGEKYITILYRTFA
jgi:glycyl-tRNA synthetase